MNMDVLRLRTMAMKSVFDGGKYENQSVAQIIAMKEDSYLQFYYFTKERISFTSEVLDAINIPIEFRIQKPGVDAHMHDNFRQYLRFVVNPEKHKGELNGMTQRAFYRKKSNASLKDRKKKIAYFENSNMDRLRNQGKR